MAQQKYDHSDKGRLRKKLWRRRNPSGIRDYQNKYVKKKRDECKREIFYLLGNRCSMCGFADVRALQIDHVKGNGNRDRSCHSANLNYMNKVLRKIKTGSKEYQLLCANCNWIKRAVNHEAPESGYRPTRTEGRNSS